MAKKLTNKNVFEKVTEGYDKNVVLEGEDENTTDKRLDKILKSYKFTTKEKRLLKARMKRFEVMLEKKRNLGINSKCDAMDALYTPHLVGLNNPNSPAVNTNNASSQDVVGLVDEPRKSSPILFEKVTTALAVLIRENPKIIMKAFREKFKQLNLFIENVYYENFKVQSKIRVLQRYTYQLSKYGIAYWREYIKRTYRKEYIEKTGKDDKVKYQAKLVYDINDEVAEVVHPRNVVLDDNCLGPTDPQRPARDCYLLYYDTASEFRALYPIEKYPKAEFVKAGQAWMIEDQEIVDTTETTKENKIQRLIYENKTEGVKETWINGIPMESIPLPGYRLSIHGDKWIEDGDNYDGIGLGQIIQIYQPIWDDINNAIVEWVRQLVRPIENFFNGAKVKDESDDVEYQAGAQRHIEGSPEDVQYSKPSAIGPGEAQQIERLKEELDMSVMIPKQLSGISESKTAFEAAQNRETALAKLNIPLNGIKWVLEQAANTSLALFQILYSEAEDTVLLKPGDDDFDEALEIYEQNQDDERIAVEGDDPQKGIYRRYFPQMELPLTLEPNDDGSGNEAGAGRIVQSDEKKFWELIPKHFNWKGRIEIVAGSFMPVSKALEDESKKEMADWLVNIPVTDELGRPTLTDQNGKPFIIDKVRVVKDRISVVREMDPEKYIIPMDQANAGQGDVDDANPLDKSGGSVMDSVEMATNGAGARPELRGARSIK